MFGCSLKLNINAITMFRMFRLWRKLVYSIGNYMALWVTYVEQREQCFLNTVWVVIVILTMSDQINDAWPFVCDGWYISQYLYAFLINPLGNNALITASQKIHISLSSSMPLRIIIGSIASLYSVINESMKRQYYSYTNVEYKMFLPCFLSSYMWYNSYHIHIFIP